MTALYVMGEADGPRKIGIARDVRKRLHAIRSSSLLEASVLHERELGDDAWRVEAHAHKLLKAQRIRGEWFDVTTEAAIAAIEAALLKVAAGEPVVRSVGRKKEFEENVRLPLAKGTTSRMDAVLEPGEPRLSLIREAIEREIKRRERLTTNLPIRRDPKAGA